MAVLHLSGADEARQHRLDCWRLSNDPLQEASRETRVIGGHLIVIEREGFIDVGPGVPGARWRRVICSDLDVGALTFLEVVPGPWSDATRLSQVLECRPTYEKQLGDAIGWYWGGMSAPISERGYIVELQDATVWNASQHSRPLFEQVLAASFPSHSIVFAQARPLTDDLAHDVAPEMRRRGLLRLMERRFGFQPLGVRCRNSGWMWRTISPLKRPV